MNSSMTPMAPGSTGTASRGSLRLVRIFMAAYRWRTVAMLFCLVFAGLAEGVGVATLLPVIEVLGKGQAGTQSSLAGPLLAFLNVLGIPASIGPLLAIVAGAMAVKGALLLLAMLQTGYTVAQVTTDLRMRVIRAVLGAEWRYFIDHPIGTIANAISSESQRASQAYYAACLMAAELIQVAVYATLALLISPNVTLLAILASPLVFLVFRPLVRSAKRAGQAQTDLQKRLMTWITNGLQGIKPIKAMGREGFVGPLLEYDVQELNSAMRLQVFAVQALKTLQEPIVITGLMVALYLLVSYGHMPFASLIVLALLFYRMIGQFTGLQKHYQTLVINQSAFWSLQELAETAEARSERIGGRTTASFEKGIEFDGVSLEYAGHRILDNVTLHLPSHGLVAFSGPSGAGKTTLVDMIAGLVEPTGGTIRIDRVPLAECHLTAWRGMLGYVPQEMTLFHETVRNNLILGDTLFTDADIARSLDLAGLTKVIAELPEGLETILGERGARLSGGQRQRLAIARALVRKPRILILDEVTTSLDPETEQVICDTLSSLSKEILVIAISHQPAVVRAADKVIQVERGRIAITGHSGVFAPQPA